ncbi:hypothetical protein OHA77_11095 [Streptosporangium sp. NBC_01639]|uniref:hypothetical protein n=1 Tax=Streptosporangium sp. NBC_01639 TaxID=2975948 RepID=UPI00386EA4B2|nr:hypothetical protein OHA77_11095 [Streptosporangium sp. NBC_01639]
MAREPDGRTRPAPISSSDLWDLRSDPARLEMLAGTWRSLGAKAGAAEGRVNTAAQNVFSNEHWTGETADAFNDYRKKLTADVELFGTWATNIADTLDITATTLRVQQGLLDEERRKLSAVPVTTDLAGVTFRPKDAEQSSLVSGAISAATEIRTRVDGVLEEKRQDLTFFQEQFDLIAKQWKPRTVRLLNLNVGQGAGNSPGDSAGTDSGGDISKIAQVVADQKADIATVQEVFKHDMFDLEEELESRTGDNWDVRFEEASKKYHASDDVPILGDVINAPFGNAVLVREGDVIEGTGDSERIKLDVDGGDITLPANTPGAGDTKIDDGEGRSAAMAEVNIRPR